MDLCLECGRLYEPGTGARVSELPFGTEDDTPQELIVWETCSPECMLAWIRATS